VKSLDKGAVTITPMHMEDLDEVLWVEQSSFRDPWTRTLFEEEFKNPELSHFLIARCDEHVVGYMGFWLILEEAHITNLAVHPGFRRHKIGERLLRATLHMACSLGAQRATLEVRVSNEPAKQLYEKHGFQLVAIRRKYYADNNEDALILWNNDLSVFSDPWKKKEDSESA
jgi:[ribosomal protein S18]-alanine N-acetyltransferase